MQLESKKLGLLDYTEGQIVVFEDGILGFEDLKKFLLVDIDEMMPFEWLVSIDEPMITLPILPPALALPDYKMEISSEENDSVIFSDPDNCSVYCIANFSKVKPTLNLRSPIIINEKMKKGRQIILNDESKSFQYVIEAESLQEDDV